MRKKPKQIPVKSAAEVQEAQEREDILEQKLLEKTRTKEIAIKRIEDFSSIERIEKYVKGIINHKNFNNSEFTKSSNHPSTDQCYDNPECESIFFKNIGLAIHIHVSENNLKTMGDGSIVNLDHESNY